MKQSTLNFSSAKRAGSSSTAKPKTSSPLTTKSSKEVPSAKSKDNKLEKDYDDIVLADDDKEEDSDDGNANIDDRNANIDDGKANINTRAKPDDKKAETLSAGRATRSATKKVTTPNKSLQTPEEPSSDAVKASVLRQSNTKPEDVVKKVEANMQKEDMAELPELKVKDPKYRKIYAEVKEKMGGLPAIHGEKQNRIHEILRVFDNSYEYGPCVGISRRDRWDRAQALGLNPPKEIDDILNTKEGTTLTEYSQSVFYGEVWGFEVVI